MLAGIGAIVCAALALMCWYCFDQASNTREDIVSPVVIVIGFAGLGFAVAAVGLGYIALGHQ